MDFSESFYHEVAGGMIHVRRRIVVSYGNSRFEVTITWPDGHSSSFVVQSDREFVDCLAAQCAQRSPYPTEGLQAPPH